MSAPASAPDVASTAVASSRTGTVRPDIEGLRAIAVAVVLAYHTGVGVFSGGFAGVDVFFVISGFLITSLLLRELTRSGTVSISGFYARRARRLLPAASLVILVTLVLGWWVLPSSARSDLGADGIAAALYFLNWSLAARSVDYLAEGATVSPLQHFWSLSVEEQYYLVWPLAILLAVALAARYGVRPRRVLLGLLLVSGLASLGYSVWATSTSPASAYFVSTTRIWELAVGSLLAFAAPHLGGLTRRGSALLAWTGLAAIAYAVLVFSRATPWPGSAALVPTLGTAAVIAAGCGRRGGGADGLLGLRPMLWLGGVSYAVYLWHWPLIVLAESRWPSLSTPETVAIGLLSLPLAAATKRLVEDPLRFGRLTRSTSRTLLLAAATMAVCVTTGLVVAATAPTLGDGARVSGARALVADPGADRWTLVPRPDELFDSTGPVTPPPGAAPKDAPLVDGCQSPIGGDDLRTDCVYGQRDSATTVALLGDSKAGQWFPAIREIARREGWRLEVYVKSACTVATSGVSADCASYNAKVAARFAARGAPDYAIVSQRGSSYDEASGGLTDGLRALTSLGTDVVALADNISPDQDALFTCVERHPKDYGACSFDRERGLEESGTASLSEAADELGLPFVDVNRWICPPGDRCPPVIAHTLVYRQGSHLTATYVRTLTPMLHRALRAVGVAQLPVREIRLVQ